MPRIPVHIDHMPGQKYAAEEGQHVSQINPMFSVQGDKCQADHRQDCSCQIILPGLHSVQHPVQKRYNNYIECRNKGIFAGCRMLQSISLEYIAHSQQNAQHNPAVQVPAVHMNQASVKQNGQPQGSNRKPVCQHIGRTQHINGVFHYHESASPYDSNCQKGRNRQGFRHSHMFRIHNLFSLLRHKAKYFLSGPKQKNDRESVCSSGLPLFFIYSVQKR